MTERLRTNPYTTYHQGDPRRASVSEASGLSTKKTMVVLVVVVACFAVLWPKIFYPMLVDNAKSQMKPGPVDRTTGCCDVISEFDLDTINIMAELCSTIIDTTGKTPPSPKEIVTQCKTAVLQTCGIDISAVLQDRIVSLGHSVKQILEEVRSLNGSLCLKYNFGLAPWRLGVAHRVNINLDPLNTIRQERPSHLRPEMVHPAFKERGRAIPQPDPSGLPRRSNPPPRIVEGRPGPIPGMRPAMGGPGHVVPAPKHSNYGFMGVLMPLYTVGFVVFFVYTIMKLIFRKKTEAHVGAPLYPPCESDDRFRKEVFEASRDYFHRPSSRDSSKIGDEELDQLRNRLRETELAMERIVEQMAQAPLVTQDEITANGSLPKEDDQGTVKVMGMETRASFEDGKKWSRPESPVLRHPQPVAPMEPSPPPQQIFLEGSLPPQSQILVAESATEAQKDSEDDSPVVLAGKMTLSVISLDSETGTEDSTNSCRRADTSDEERRTSSSNVSEEFEKINAAELEDQINSIIEEAGNIALTEENRYSLNEELDKYTEDILKAPQINDKDKENDVLEEIKNQLNLEDDLLMALKENEPEGKVNLPVTDIIKEFLNNEESALLAENEGIKVDDLTMEEIDTLDRYRRSLDDEQDGEELELNVDLKGDEILDIIKQEIESSAVSEQQQDLLVEQSLGQTLDEELQNLDVKIADNNTFSSEAKGESASLKHEELKIDKEDSEVISELSRETMEAISLENDELRASKEEADSKKNEDNLGIENEVIDELPQKIDQAVSSEYQVSHEEKTGSDKRNLVPENDITNDLSEKVVSLENDKSEVSEDLVPNPTKLTQKLEEAVTVETEELTIPTEGADFDKMQKDLVLENEATTDISRKTEEQTVNLENDELRNKEPSSEVIEPNVVVEEMLEKENASLVQEVVDLDVAKEDETTDNREREGTPEETNGNNKADLLLQGLMVKADEGLSEEKGTAEVDLSQKETGVGSTEAIVEKDDADVGKQEQQSIETKVDILLHSEEEKRRVQDAAEELQETKEEKDLVSENIHRDEARAVDEEGLIDDEDYDDTEEEELVDDEVRNINRDAYEDGTGSAERRVNGEDFDSSRNGAGNSDTAAENEISEDEDSENEVDDDEEIEEIIEYVDNTDEEGEEVIEINGNEHHLNENGRN